MLTVTDSIVSRNSFNVFFTQTTCLFRSWIADSNNISIPSHVKQIQVHDTSLAAAKARKGQTLHLIRRAALNKV